MSEASFTYEYTHGATSIRMRTYRGVPEIGLHTSRDNVSVRFSQPGGALIIESGEVEFNLYASADQLRAIADAINAALASELREAAE
jgi:hypothetical protein